MAEFGTIFVRFRTGKIQIIRLNYFKTILIQKLIILARKLMQKKSNSSSCEQEDHIPLQIHESRDFIKECFESFTIATADTASEIIIVVSSKTEKFREYVSSIDMEQL